MGKFKAAKGRKTKDSRPRAAVPCILLIVSAMALLSMLFYMVIKPR